MSTFEDDVKALSQHEHFARFVKDIYLLREAAISEMETASVEKLQQISGKVLAYDSILSGANWSNLQVIWRDKLVEQTN
jgi:hypothetical protein